MIINDCTRGFLLPPMPSDAGVSFRTHHNSSGVFDQKMGERRFFQEKQIIFPPKKRAFVILTV